MQTGIFLGFIMLKKYSKSEAVSLVKKIEKSRANGARVFKACHDAGVTDTTYYRWREQFKRLLMTANNDNSVSSAN
jgi:transposase-like protein